MLKSVLSSCVLATIVASTSLAQDQSGYNAYSVRPVHESDVLYKKTVMRALDLREKQNLPMFSTNKEITRIILEAAKKGDIKVYMTDSLDQGRSMTKEEFAKKLMMPISEDPDAEPDPNADPNAEQPAAGLEYLPKQLYQMQLKEDYIFDKQRSRAYHDIQCITMLIPSEFNPKGIEEPIGTFKFKDLVEVFKRDPRAIWFNPQNDAEHRNLVDAFDLRLFSSYIIKLSNPKDEFLVDIYSESQKQGIMSSYWKASDLMEYEHNLWEF
ncbi:MAG: putative gldN and/or gldO [Bacteroidota bacterium]|jgi:gliding motility associated protien GldN